MNIDKKIEEWLLTGRIIRKLAEIVRNAEDKQMLKYLAGAYEGIALEIKESTSSSQEQKENQARG